MPSALNILAGPQALPVIRERGLRPEDIDVVVGASGGPKWLVLSGLDRVLFGDFLIGQRERPLHLLGSSIGSWRLACLAQRDPVAAQDRFRHAYIYEQHYRKNPSPEEVTQVSARLLERLLGEEGDREILDNPDRRLHLITVLCHGLLASDKRRPLLAGLALAALANLASRRTLGWQMERVLFDLPGDSRRFRGRDSLPTRYAELNESSLRRAILASGSIPRVLQGVRIPGGPAGIHRDGGVIDYHPRLDFGPGEGLVLYPHFYSHLVPGWFDKRLSRRRRVGSDLDRVVLLAPSREFVATLPGGRIPDRDDFYRLSEAERLRAWETVIEASRRLGDEFAELTVSGAIRERVQPLTR